MAERAAEPQRKMSRRQATRPAGLRSQLWPPPSAVPSAPHRAWSSVSLRVTHRPRPRQGPRSCGARCGVGVLGGKWGRCGVEKWNPAKLAPRSLCFPCRCSHFFSSSPLRPPFTFWYFVFHNSPYKRYPNTALSLARTSEQSLKHFAAFKFTNGIPSGIRAFRKLS